MRILRQVSFAFTLVELIVVVSVLSVLATIAMTQVGSVTSSARDSQRLTDMSSMKMSLEMYNAKTGKIPVPSAGTPLLFSGSLAWTQGTFGESVVETIKSLSPKPIDPKYNAEYAYSVSNDGEEYELGGVLEKTVSMNSLAENAHAESAQNMAKITGNYNGIFLAVKAGNRVYVLAAPTLIAADTASGEALTAQLIVDGG